MYQALRPRLQEEGHWHIDETRWEVFVERDGKAGHRWWLWVFQSRSVVYYLIDPSRSASVPEGVLAGVDSGVISCDRHGAYKKFARLHPGIVLSFCCNQWDGRPHPLTASAVPKWERIAAT